MAPTRELRRGIYLLPTAFTVANLFCGYASIILASRGSIAQAAVLIILAGVLDGLDGRIARVTGTTSEFGLQFDSLADIVSFGVAPAVLTYQWALWPLGRVGWLVAFIFVVCAAMRLARFNIQTGRGDKRFFAGLPSPPAAGAVAAVAFAFPVLETDDGWAAVALAVLAAAVALLMISRLRYRSFKEIDLRNRRSYVYVLPLAGMLAAIAINPRMSMLVFAALYVVSGPVAYVSAFVRRAGARRLPSGVASESEVVDGPLTR